MCAQFRSSRQEACDYVNFQLRQLSVNTEALACTVGYCSLSSSSVRSCSGPAPQRHRLIVADCHYSTRWVPQWCIRRSRRLTKIVSAAASRTPNPVCCRVSQRAPPCAGPPLSRSALANLEHWTAAPRLCTLLRTNAQPCAGLQILNSSLALSSSHSWLFSSVDWSQLHHTRTPVPSPTLSRDATSAEFLHLIALGCANPTAQPRTHGRETP